MLSPVIAIRKRATPISVQEAEFNIDPLVSDSPRSSQLSVNVRDENVDA
jgi:hypothetical protein